MYLVRYWDEYREKDTIELRRTEEEVNEMFKYPLPNVDDTLVQVYRFDKDEQAQAGKLILELMQDPDIDRLIEE